MTYNLHKGKTQFGRNIAFDSLRQILHENEFDIGLFQEVLGKHKFTKETPHQIELLADEKWKAFSFAKNSVVANYDHGNSILSKFNITEEKIINLTLNRFEKRCAIFTKIDLGNTTLNCICTHLNLTLKDRLRQAQAILEFIDGRVGKEEPIVLGGDFNDWNGRVCKYFQENGGFYSVNKNEPLNSSLNSFPSFFPIFPLDRILCRNLEIHSMTTGKAHVFRKYSDHLPVFCDFEL